MFFPGCACCDIGCPTLYEDYFQDPSSLASWTVLSGNWGISGGEFFAATQAGVAVLNPENPDEQVVSFTFVYDRAPGNSRFSLLLAYQDQNNFLRVQFYPTDSEGFGGGASDVRGLRVSLYKTVQGVEEHLTTTYYKVFDDSEETELEKLIGVEVFLSREAQHVQVQFTNIGALPRLPTQKRISDWPATWGAKVALQNESIAGQGIYIDSFLFRPHKSADRPTCRDHAPSCTLLSEFYSRLPDSSQPTAAWEKINGDWERTGTHLTNDETGSLLLCNTRHQEDLGYLFVTTNLFAGSGQRPRIHLGYSNGSSYYLELNVDEPRLTLYKDGVEWETISTGALLGTNVIFRAGIEYVPSQQKTYLTAIAYQAASLGTALTINHEVPVLPLGSRVGVGNGNSVAIEFQSIAVHQAPSPAGNTPECPPGIVAECSSCTVDENPEAPQEFLLELDLVGQDNSVDAAFPCVDNDVYQAIGATYFLSRYRDVTGMPEEISRAVGDGVCVYVYHNPNGRCCSLRVVAFRFNPGAGISIPQMDVRLSVTTEEHLLCEADSEAALGNPQYLNYGLLACPNPDAVQANRALGRAFATIGHPESGLRGRLIRVA